MQSKTLFNFLKRLSKDYFSHGYYWYYQVNIPENKNSEEIEKKLINFYKITSHSQIRQRRKEKGKANCNVVIFRNIAVIVATEGEHENLNRELFTDIREESLTILGNEIFIIRHRKGGQLKASVRIPKHRLKLIKKRLGGIALHNEERVRGYLKNLSNYTFEGIQAQKLALLKKINKRRKKAGLRRIEWEDVKPFWAN